MKLKTLCEAAGIECPAALEEIEPRGIATDSRRVEQGFLFLCIRGLHKDGHTYIAEAVKAGAICVIAEADGKTEGAGSVPVIKARNTRRIAAHLYHAWYGFPSERMKIIGVTGTNGKTSVTHMIRAILEAALCKCGLIGTVGCEVMGKKLPCQSGDENANMTTPDPEVLYRVLSQMAEAGAEYVVMEVTSHALALEKTSPIRFEGAVFTNLTPEHLDFHGTMEAYGAAKKKLFSGASVCVVNGDSPFAGEILSEVKGKRAVCSQKRAADYTAEELWITEKGVSYRLTSARMGQRLFCPVTGDFSVMNSMEAAVCALELGISPSAVKEGLAALGKISGRMERVRLGPGADFTVLIDYAHTPDALENLLKTARAMEKGKTGRVILVFGCGGDRDRSKRPVMGEIATRYADLTVITSDNSRTEDPNGIIEDILVGIDPRGAHTVIPDREQAIFYAVEQAGKGDLILLAGKGHEHYEITGEGRRYFNEREAVERAYRRRQQTKGQRTTGSEG